MIKHKWLSGAQVFIQAHREKLWYLAIALTLQGFATPTIAAERVTLKLGAFESAIAISELEQFAKTGALSSQLQLYSAFLTPQVREVLNSRLQIDPQQADGYIAQLSSSPYGKQLLKYLGVAVPELTLPQLQAAVTIAAQQANGVSVVSLIKAYPQENIVIDATSAIALAVEFNPSYLQSQAVGLSLADKLAVTSSTAFKPSFDPAKSGKATVLEQTIVLQDRKRDRTIPVDIYYPQQNSLLSALRPTPLVVISPGLGANRQFFSYLARHLASHGLTVAALEHPDRLTKNLSNISSPNQVLPATEFINRPKDISFLLDQLSNINRQSGELQGKLNTETVSVIGHSLGGYTALAVAGGELNLQQLRQACKNPNPLAQSPADWLQCGAANLIDSKLKLQDRRVKNAIALNPVIGQLFGENGLNKVSVPVLILASTEDAITPVLNHQLRPFTQLGDQKYLITAIGGTHLSVGNPNSQALTDTAVIKERRGVEVQPLRQLISGVSLAFINQLTPEANNYQAFLTPAYAQSLSTPSLPLRLSTELPKSVIDQP
ncbi:alpha/beta hydrolase [Synechocystis sp. PCC 7509]|uniref:alpha/beta hydrolase n=1 Tax=Synechocystis sp. PCC 7509 TaxID=927677 RepID=UPI0002ABE433|nr:alpha/beta hydrolase [Synechocystis sp. PCC 7509]